MNKSRKNIIWLGLVSLINDTASKSILSVLPLYIIAIGGGGIAVGIISGLGDSVRSILELLSGYWSDRIGKRKPFVIIGYLIAAISKILLVFSKIWPHVLVLRITERFGKGLRDAPRDAILAGSTAKAHRGEGFGVHRAMDSGGAILGALLAFILFWYLGFSFRQIFLVAGIIAFFTVIPLFFVKEKPTEPQTESLKIGLKNLPRSLKFFIIIATFFALGNFSYMFFILKSQNYFTGDLAIGIPILLYALYNLSYTLFAIPSGILSDTIGRKKVLLLGYALFSLVCLGFIFSKSTELFIILFVLLGLNYAFVNVNQRALVSDLSREDIRGTALGTFHMFTSLAALPAGLIAGLIWDISPDYTFIFGAIIALLVVGFFSGLVHINPDKILRS